MIDRFTLDNKRHPALLEESDDALLICGETDTSSSARAGRDF